ncbi:MAG: dUTP diphosphatase [bacterium]|nr:dUTP diphosphatase [bacterium]
MLVKIKRVDKSLPLPQYKTKGAVCFDCVAREAKTIEPGNIGYVPLNICIEPPAGHFVLMAARSSLHKKGLIMANGVGIFDEDFAGNDDEYQAILFNHTNEPVSVEKGERITQIMILPHNRHEWGEVDDMGKDNRGGIGSTGAV